jgi:hypothetical protein
LCVEKTQKRAKGKSAKEIEEEVAKEREARKRQYYHTNVDAELPIQEAKEEEDQAPPAAASGSDDPTAFHSKKNKVAQKFGDMRQWYIMEQLDIPKDEIPKFADATYWLNYFPPLYKKVHTHHTHTHTHTHTHYLSLSLSLSTESASCVLAFALHYTWLTQLLVDRIAVSLIHPLTHQYMAIIPTLWYIGPC